MGQPELTDQQEDCPGENACRPADGKGRRDRNLRIRGGRQSGQHACNHRHSDFLGATDRIRKPAEKAYRKPCDDCPAKKQSAGQLIPGTETAGEQESRHRQRLADLPRARDDGE